MKTKLLAALTCCFILNCAKAQETFFFDNICYKFESYYNNRISACNIEGTSSKCENNYIQHKIVIPDSVTYKDIKYPVTRIEFGAFSNCANLDTIIISDNVTILNQYTFENCKNLKYIRISNKVKKINNYCFYNCTNLESITIPASVTEFVKHIVDGCNNLKNIYILGDKPTTQDGTFSKEFKTKDRTVWVLNSFYNNYKKETEFSKFNLQAIDNFCSDRQTIIPVSFNNDVSPLSLSTDIDKGCDFDIAENAEYNAQKGIEIRKAIDTSRYHFISIPYNCAVNDIYSKSGLDIKGYGTDWLILRYDSQGFANGHDINWKQLTDKDTIKAGQGYIIGISNNIDKKYLDANEQIEMVFPIKKSITLKHCNGKSSAIPTPLNNVSLKQYPSTDNALRNWNLTGTNLLHSVNGITIDVDNKSINYISIPNQDGKTYSQIETETATLNNFTSFFIQTEQEGTLNIKYNTNREKRYSPKDDRIVIALSDTNKTVDKTTILLGENYTDVYEYNKDLLKLQAKAPQIYIETDNTPLCFAAISKTKIDDLVELNVISPNNEEYTISLEKNDIEKDIILIDRTNNTTVNLSIQDYTYQNNTPNIERRFAIYSQPKDTATDLKTVKDNDITWVIENHRLIINNIKERSKITIYNLNGRLIESQDNVKEQMKSKEIPNGIYLLNISNTKTKTYKIEVQ